MRRHEVHLLLPARALGEVQAGTRLRLHYSAFPRQRYGLREGRVLDISRAPVTFAPALARSQSGETLYRARIRLDGAEALPRPVPPGLPVTAEVVTRQASLLRWLLDPVQALWQR